MLNLHLKTIKIIELIIIVGNIYLIVENLWYLKKNQSSYSIADKYENLDPLTTELLKSIYR